MRKLLALLALWITLVAASLVLNITLSAPINRANAMPAQTAVPGQTAQLQTVRLHSGNPPGVLQTIPVNVVGTSRVFPCRVAPGATINGWVSLLEREDPSLPTGARVAIDPAGIPNVESQPTVCTLSSSPTYQTFVVGPNNQSYFPQFFWPRATVTQNTYIMALPLEAYTQPGMWRIGRREPDYFELGIEVLPPSRPFFISGASNTGVLGGFGRYEPIKGILLRLSDTKGSGRQLTYGGEFDFSANVNGYALISVPELTTERLEDNYLLFIGREQHMVASNALAVSLQLNNQNAQNLMQTAYTTYWGQYVVQPTTVPTPLPPVAPVSPAGIPAVNVRNVPPPGSFRLGEFQVESYCNNRGYGVILTNNQTDWACTNQSTGAVVFILGVSDFDSICQQRYNDSGAFAIRDQRQAVQAYNWSCYAFPGTRAPAIRDVPPAGSTRLGEFQVESYCNNRGYGVILTNSQTDWACTNPSNGSIAFILNPTDFDAICQQRYNDPGAFAIRDQRQAVQAYNWSCYTRRQF
ncbi:MAG: hypothetical protein IT324_03355 [Anaerolineae bacterium]|nr:hypothetical protein [Anaerolineae bacterium]